MHREIREGGEGGLLRVLLVGNPPLPAASNPLYKYLIMRGGHVGRLEGLIARRICNWSGVYQALLGKERATYDSLNKASPEEWVGT